MIQRVIDETVKLPDVPAQDVTSEIDYLMSNQENIVNSEVIEDFFILKDLIFKVRSINSDIADNGIEKFGVFLWEFIKILCGLEIDCYFFDHFEKRWSDFYTVLNQVKRIELS